VEEPLEELEDAPLEELVEEPLEELEEADGEELEPPPQAVSNRLELSNSNSGSGKLSREFWTKRRKGVSNMSIAPRTTDVLASQRASEPY
jgi:hypothetical protein